MANNKALTMVVRCPGRKPVRLRAGQRIRIGRHESNDYVLAHGTVSRFHAALVWDKDEDRPYVQDNKSANGVEVDGRFVEERAYLGGGNTISLGDFDLTLELRTGSDEILGEEADVALVESGDEVRLYTEKGRELEGCLGPDETVQRVCLGLADKKRTGTLFVSLADDSEYEVVFSQGRIVTAIYGEELSGLAALRRALSARGCKYRFTRNVQPRETEFLDLAVDEFLKLEEEGQQGTLRTFRIDSSMQKRDLP